MFGVGEDEDADFGAMLGRLEGNVQQAQASGRRAKRKEVMGDILEMSLEDVMASSLADLDDDAIKDQCDILNKELRELQAQLLLCGQLSAAPGSVASIRTKMNQVDDAIEDRTQLLRKRKHGDKPDPKVENVQDKIRAVAEAEAKAAEADSEAVKEMTQRCSRLEKELLTSQRESRKTESDLRADLKVQQEKNDNLMSSMKTLNKEMAESQVHSTVNYEIIELRLIADCYSETHSHYHNN